MFNDEVVKVNGAVVNDVEDRNDYDVVDDDYDEDDTTSITTSVKYIWHKKKCEEKRYKQFCK